MATVIFEILLWIVWIVCEVIIRGTGELLMYVFSFGRRKPEWEISKEDNSFIDELFLNPALWVGLVFYLAIGFITLKIVGWL